VHGTIDHPVHCAVTHDKLRRAAAFVQLHYDHRCSGADMRILRTLFACGYSVAKAAAVLFDRGAASD
jgi:hypothetical protein